MEDLNAMIDQLAAERGETKLAVITSLQTGAAIAEEFDLLDKLCEIKDELLGLS